MSEKNYVVNIKNARGTIFTFRGDTAVELASTIQQFVAGDLVADINAVEGTILGVQPSAVDTIKATFPDATVIATTATPAPAAFAPVAPPASAAPVQSAVGDKSCVHGTMVRRTGQGAKGEWRAFFCPTPKGTEGQCSPAFANRNTPEWNSF